MKDKEIERSKVIGMCLWSGDYKHHELEIIKLLRERSKYAKIALSPQSDTEFQTCIDAIKYLNDKMKILLDL